MMFLIFKIGDERILVRIRCDSLKEANKSWSKQEKKTRTLYEKQEDSLKHWKEECETIDRMNLYIEEILDKNKNMKTVVAENRKEEGKEQENKEKHKQRGVEVEDKDEKKYNY